MLFTRTVLSLSFLVSLTQFPAYAMEEEPEVSWFSSHSSNNNN